MLIRSKNKEKEEFEKETTKEKTWHIIANKVGRKREYKNLSVKIKQKGLNNFGQDMIWSRDYKLQLGIWTFGF